MHSSTSKLLLIFVLCVAWSSYAKGENKVTIKSFNTDLKGNEVIQSLDPDLANNMIDATFNIKKSCPDIIELEIRVYQDDNMVNTVNKRYEKPIRDLEGLCETVESTDPEEDSCSIGQGEQVAKECNIAKLFNDMSPGNYRAEVDFAEGTEQVASAVVEVTVEEGE